MLTSKRPGLYCSSGWRINASARAACWQSRRQWCQWLALHHWCPVPQDGDTVPQVPGCLQRKWKWPEATTTCRNLTMLYYGKNRKCCFKEESEVSMIYSFLVCSFALGCTARTCHLWWNIVRTGKSKGVHLHKHINDMDEQFVGVQQPEGHLCLHGATFHYLDHSCNILQHQGTLASKVPV